MAESDIYGNFTGTPLAVKEKLELQVLAWSEKAAQCGERKCFEHLTSQVKAGRNIWGKLLRGDPEETTENTLCRLTNAIGLRIVTHFVDDIYRVKAKLAALLGVETAEEKSYIQNIKPNGYRSLHLILCYETNAPDFYGQVLGQFFVEAQTRTVTMDSWTSLEHEIHYRREDGNRALITTELRHVADDLASCDLSIQTIRDMARKEGA